jgi:transcriptional regulator with GAF, ATPase, and Fis domain
VHELRVIDTGRVINQQTVMSEIHGRLLVYPDAAAHSTSIRAKAAIFVDPQALLQQLDRVAPADVPVLIVGETGTGKELVARHLHSQSGRKGAFVAVNCGALTESLAEAELFGHQAGSFTGANETRAGWFEAANGGTLFLDEIGDLPLALQVKLLRVLQEREVVRVGSRKAIPLDVRLVAATNINLAEAVSAGRFRLDLYYRLNVVTFDLPPLRERRGDVVPLVEHFLYKYSQKLHVRPPVLTLEARRALIGYAWPGNIRELENVIHFALLTADGDIRPEHLRFAAAPQTVTSAPASTPIDTISAQLDKLFASTPAELYQSLEELIVRRAFSYCSHNQVQTARLLGISRNVLRTLLKRLGLLTNDAAADEYPDLRLVSPAETSRAAS